MLKLYKKSDFFRIALQSEISKFGYFKFGQKWKKKKKPNCLTNTTRYTFKYIFISKQAASLSRLLTIS